MLKIVRIHGAKLQPFDQLTLTDDLLLWIQDSFQSTHLIEFLNQVGNPKYIVNDNNFSRQDATIYSLPLFMAKEIQLFSKMRYSDTKNSESCFNFIINKKTQNRTLLLKLVDYFKLQTNHYTWSGMSSIADMSGILLELSKSTCSLKYYIDDYENFLTELLSRFRVEPRIISYPNQLITDTSIQNYGGNRWTWNNGLNKIFQSTAVSLISESTEFDKVSCVTEKSGYAFLGLTFPIWIGGYGIPDSFKKIGIDIFDDIIDHRYQYYDTLVERCFYAFNDNLKILRDLEYAHDQRMRCWDRLLSNRKKLLDGVLIDYCYQQLKSWPKDLRDAVFPIVEKIFSINQLYPKDLRDVLSPDSRK